MTFATGWGRVFAWSPLGGFFVRVSITMAYSDFHTWFLYGPWLAVGLLALWGAAKRGLILRWLCLAVWMWWLYQSALVLTTLYNPGGFDNRHEAYHARAIELAIRQKKAHIPLSDTTDFVWKTVCVFSTSEYYNMGGKQQELLVNLFGNDIFWIIEWGGIEDHQQLWLVFATPDGSKVLEPRWWRFDPLNLKDFYNVTASRFSDGYKVSIGGTPTIQRGELACYSPQNAHVKIEND